MSADDKTIVYGTEDLLTSLCYSVTRVLNVATQTKIHCPLPHFCGSHQLCRAGSDF